MRSGAALHVAPCCLPCHNGIKVRAAEVKQLAVDCGFDLAGVAAALPLPEADFYQQWVRQGMAGEMRYLTDRRGDMRSDPRSLLPSAHSIVCVGKLYNGPEPYSTRFSQPERAWISRYAWGADYHDVLRHGLERLAARLQACSEEPFEWKVAVDTAPLLERAYARRAGLGWIGKNTCLIREGAGSWFFLGELLVSLALEPDAPPADRCGTCTQCIEACPTGALVPTGREQPAWALDSGLCISYLTIELRGPVPDALQAGMGRQVFGCDICQDVCPWNREAPVTDEPAFQARHFAPPLEKLAALSAEEFQEMFGGTPVERSRYEGFRRNVAIAMANLRERRNPGVVEWVVGMRLPALLLISVAAAAAAQDDLVVRGYQHFYNLQYDQALADFRRYEALAPGDPNAFNHVAEGVLYRDMFRAGALETELVSGNNPFLRRAKVDASPEDQHEFDSSIARAMALAQERLKTNPRDTGALYALGVSYGLRGNYDFLVRKAWRDALSDATSARKAHTRITEIDPANVDARMVQGLHDYIVGSLPLHWRLFGFLIGFHGNKEEGIREVERVARNGKVNRLDAEFLLCAIYRREKSAGRAIPLLEDLIGRFPNNYLLRMELAQMYSDTGEKTQALAALAQLRALKSAGAPGLLTLPIQKIDFAEGNIDFWYNDLDAALANIRLATSGAEELDLNTGVLAWMRLGQIYDLKGQRGLALGAYRHAIDFAPDSEAARESRRYLAAPYQRRVKG